MQDDSIIYDGSPNKTGLSKENLIKKLRQLPKIKHMLRKNILLLISYISYTKHARFYLPLPISVTASIFKVRAIIFLTLTPNIPNPFSAILPCIINTLIHCTRYAALLKTLQSFLVRCTAIPLWSTLTNTLYFLVYNYSNPWSFIIFSTAGIKNFK